MVNYILTGSEDRNVKLSDIAGNEILTFSRLNHNPRSITFSPNGQYILIANGFAFRLFRSFQYFLSNVHKLTIGEKKNFGIE